MEKSNYGSVVIVHTTSDPAYAQFYNEFTKIYTKPSKDVVINTADSSKVVASKIIATKSQAVICTPRLITGIPSV